ncbi:MAG TPA: adenylate/guanylate cyclase domain-containing protein [Candidatus Limnocylindria bacterium]|nr:adenylate/guanylate cyclase domain-containing protein [Candidatus Limnocylindria bacterium]
MPELLTGIVTFLFSDIEGSTRLLQAHPDSWPATLERHGELLRAAFRAEGGEEVGTEGDSFFFGFPTPAGAIRGAIAAQRALAAEPWPDGIAVNVRIGLHTGEAGFAADSYAGLNVHRASRIAGAGHGGQVLLSDATRTLGAADLPEGVTLRDLGEHRLKDLDQPERLWQLVIPGCRTDFPPVRSLDVANNLPKRLTTFLGREREIAAVSELLARNRLLTLTGPGGTGKTRLSLEVASRTMERYPDGVFFVELGPITDPDLVAPTIAQTLNLPDRGGRTAVERLVDHIGPKRLLLVLDNFEQVVDAAPSVRALLDACPNLTMLTSSRSVLHVSGEQEYPVPPLGLPDPARLPPLAALSQYEAVALFIERARAVKPDFDVTNDNAPAVAEICVRLDGLPLAIELAAARIRILTPQAMLSRLEHRLGLLAGGSRDLPERQQTLRGAIAWSHDLLDEADRSLFACTSVFVGGAGFEAIEEVCGDQTEADLLDALGSLVEKSLLRQSDGIGGEARFTMLETIREFAMEQAVERGRWDELKARHMALFASFAERAAADVMGPDKRTWLDRLEQDHDNLRAAFGAAIASGSAETALRMGASLWRFWQMRGYLKEGVERLSEALALPASHDVPAARADALSAAAGLAYWQADSDRSRAWYEEEIAAREALGDRPGLAEAHYGISFTWSIIGLPEADHADQALSHVNEALAIFTELEDEAGVARAEWALGNVAYGMARSDESRKHARHALEIFERLNDGFMVGWALFTNSLSDLYDDYVADGGRPESLAQAHDLLERALRIFADAQDVSGYTLVLDALALVAHRSGDRSRAARLSGAVANLERTSGTGLNLWNREVLGFHPDTIRNDPALADDWAAGERMTSQEAVAYALSG